ncbi:hypothetical protein AQUCO_01700505v1 [Aquilegia coerulea]|uniref:Bifunctional inhibitor/plant lipid transfer protein/seed storage helical domain-containing protein n=1 Tax=Aquilegia coerulea TaxID=218851 RepID=A0A2G5DNA6_AQUCA|nr:hypothetical protein AQUCO_01700505v1 [Aquilegia coerulea]
MNTLFFSLLLLLLTISMAITPFASAACTQELVAISPCLSYISSPPNNLSSSPSSECCEIFSSSFFNGTDSCFCYLLRIQFILGFPLNSTRIGSLPSLCSSHNALTSNFEVLCKGLTTLPPMEATPGLISLSSL